MGRMIFSQPEDPIKNNIKQSYRKKLNRLNIVFKTSICLNIILITTLLITILRK